ncbi:MAG: DUF4380 domain-containing protein [Spirochaetota bacterium]
MKVLCSIIIAAFFLGCGLSHDITAEKKLLKLKSRSLELGILTNVGGRIALLREAGGPNMMDSDNTLWGIPPPVPPLGALKKEYREYGGTIVWTGPHSRWWQEQSIHPAKKRSKGKWPWPPDPYLSFDHFRIVTNDGSSVILAGGVSPVSGVQLRKEISVGQHVRLRTSAANGRGTSLTRDLWTATMLGADARIFVPVTDHKSVRFMTRSLRTNIVWDIVGDMLIAGIRPFRTNAFIESDKAFITPREGYAAVCNGKRIWLITFTLPPYGSVSPEHGAIEISAEAKDTRAASGFMLSRHSALTDIPPGGVLSWEEEWHILPYTGAAADAERIAFITRSAERILEERSLAGSMR